MWVIFGFKLWVGLIVYFVVFLREILIVIMRKLMIKGLSFFVNLFVLMVKILSIRINVLIILFKMFVNVCGMLGLVEKIFSLVVGLFVDF